MTREQRPFYLATLLDSRDLERDLVLRAVSRARSDEDAISLAKKHGAEWLARNGGGHAHLHILRDGHAFYSEPMMVE